MKNKRLSEEESQKVEHRGAKRKSAIETVAPVTRIFVKRKKRICQKCQKTGNSLRNYMQQGNITTVFRVLVCSVLSLQLKNGENRFLF